MSSVLTVTDVCAALKLSRRQFYRALPQLTRDGIVQEALPRLDRRPRYLAGPVEAYVSGARRVVEVKQQLRKVG